ncbi:unnamed protein product [Prorocentrum cordatum]|uniref:Uncharacterized protein n=1 Tax=Prorocentrum cordatum TaxID=2364126 RepID=A0ABN9SR22_9DINO|nr:unnamed protein product [Polarella glacialis]
MARRWLLPGALASCVALWCLQWPWDAAWVLPSSAARTEGALQSIPPVQLRKPSVFEYQCKVILASRTGYPLPLMIGFNLYGNIMLRKETPGDRRYPHWIFAWPVGLLVYTYPASAFSEMVFQMVSPRILGNNQAIMVFSFWFLVIQYCDPFYRFCKRPGVFSILTTWWLADATRVSLLTLGIWLQVHGFQESPIYKEVAEVQQGADGAADDAEARQRILCRWCAQKVSDCPVCRQTLVDVIRTYKA